MATPEGPDLRSTLLELLQGAPGCSGEASRADAAARLVELVQRWDADAPAGRAPAQLCFLLQHRYSASELRSRGVEALQPADGAAAQLLAAAGAAGAPLDASLALVKAACHPGVEDLQELYYTLGEQPPPEPDWAEYGSLDEEGFFWAMRQREEEHSDALWESVHHIVAQAAFHNDWEDCHLDLRWQRAQAMPVGAPLAGAAPHLPLFALDPCSELVCSEDYWAAAPERVFEDDAGSSKDASNYLMQFRRIGILLAPRSMRLRSAIRADPAAFVLHLHATMQPPSTSRPSEGGCAALADAIVALQRWEAEKPDTWLADEQLRRLDCRGAHSFDAPYDSPATVADTAGHVAAAVAGMPPQQLACAIADQMQVVMLVEPLAISTARRRMEADSLAALMALAPQLLSAARARKLLRCGAEAADAGSPSLAAAAACMLRHFGWPPGVLPSLQAWVANEAWQLTCEQTNWPPPGCAPALMTLDGSLTLLEAAAADGGAGSQAAGATLALALAKALRQGEQADKPRATAYRRQTWGSKGAPAVVQSPLRLLLALHSVRGSCSGRLALQQAAALVERHARALEAVQAHANWRLPLFEAVAGLLESLPPAQVAGSAALLHLACVATVDISNLRCLPVHASPLRLLRLLAPSLVLAIHGSYLA